MQSVTFIPADIVSIAVLLYETFDQKSTTAGPRAGERERGDIVYNSLFSELEAPQAPQVLHHVVVTH